MVLSIIIIALTVILDQITKVAAKLALADSDFTVIPRVLQFSYVENRGAAFGILADNRWIFMVFSTVAIGVMAYLLFSKKNNHLLFNISLSMLIGGGIGNMIDRLAMGYVVDFIKVLFVKFAVFNVADCFVTVGAFLLAIYLIFMYDETSKEAKSEPCVPTELSVNLKDDISSASFSDEPTKSCDDKESFTDDPQNSEKSLTSDSDIETLNSKTSFENEV